jgi:hypothetical protein
VKKLTGLTDVLSTGNGSMRIHGVSDPKAERAILAVIRKTRPVR